MAVAAVGGADKFVHCDTLARPGYAGLADCLVAEPVEGSQEDLLDWQSH